MASETRCVAWRGPAPLSAGVDVLQNYPHLLDHIFGVDVEDDAVGGSRPPSGNRKLFIMFPGNPGVAQFYGTFCDHLRDQHVDVLVMGLAGHSLVDLNNGRLFSLQDQIDVACSFVDAIHTEVATRKYGQNVFVGGHSIGGFIALQVLARFPRIKRYFGLCPVLSHIMASPNGQHMFYWGTPVLQWIAAFFGSLFSFLPTQVRRVIVEKHGSDVDPPLRATLTKYVHRTLLWNVFYMSMDEYRMLLQPDRLLLHAVQDRMVMYYVKNDGWAPPKYAEEIRDACPRLKAWIMEANDDVPHAWCLQYNEIVIQNAIVPYI